MLTKLNLGCGYDYRRGFINIDFYNSSVADLTSPLGTLDLPENHFEYIVLNDVIEHLGYCEASFLLSKLYLWLKADGILAIKTPHIEQSLRQFVEAKDDEERDKILCWVYGIEDAGMEHKFCFPLSLLEQTLAYYGLKTNSRQLLEMPKFCPAYDLRISKVISPHIQKRNTLLSQLHRRQQLVTGYRDLPYLLQYLEKYLTASTNIQLSNFFEELLLVCPKLGQELLAIAISDIANILTTAKLEYYRAIFARFAPFNYFRYLPLSCPDYVSAQSYIRTLTQNGGNLACHGECKFQADYYTKKQFEQFQRYASGYLQKQLATNSELSS